MHPYECVWESVYVLLWNIAWALTTVSLPRRQTLQTPQTVKHIYNNNLLCLLYMLPCFGVFCCSLFKPAYKALNVSDSPRRSAGTAKRNKATSPRAIKQVWIYGLIQDESLRRECEDEVSFTAAPHDRIKHLRVSSTPSTNAETPKKASQQWDILLGRAETGGLKWGQVPSTFMFGQQAHVLRSVMDEKILP